MRLLNVETLRLSLFENDHDIPKYAIASHRWAANEATYDDVKRKRNTTKTGYQKIVNFCAFTRRWNPDIEWLWVDTCCIDKTSSAELSEAINSMFRWYANAEICFAYLADVVLTPSVHWFDALKGSVWFTRGWTLQELLAPKTVAFLTHEWETFGMKGAEDAKQRWSVRCVNPQIAEITGIPSSVLLDYGNSRTVSDDLKWSWMEGRATTKEEDRAYCLLGIFGINMGMRYGEGTEATARLHEEIRAKKRRLKARKRSGMSTLSVSTVATTIETYANENAQSG